MEVLTISPSAPHEVQYITGTAFTLFSLGRCTFLQIAYQNHSVQSPICMYTTPTESMNGSSQIWHWRVVEKSNNLNDHFTGKLTCISACNKYWPYFWTSKCITLEANGIRRKNFVFTTCRPREFQLNPVSSCQILCWSGKEWPTHK
jgi:hypothetical protein